MFVTFSKKQKQKHVKLNYSLIAPVKKIWSENIFEQKISLTFSAPYLRSALTSEPVPSAQTVSKLVGLTLTAGPRSLLL